MIFWNEKLNLHNKLQIFMIFQHQTKLSTNLYFKNKFIKSRWRIFYISQTNQAFLPKMITFQLPNKTFFLFDVAEGLKNFAKWDFDWLCTIYNNALLCIRPLTLFLLSSFNASHSFFLFFKLKTNQSNSLQAKFITTFISNYEFYRSFEVNE